MSCNRVLSALICTMMLAVGNASAQEQPPWGMWAYGEEGPCNDETIVLAVAKNQFFQKGSAPIKNPPNIRKLDDGKITLEYPINDYYSYFYEVNGTSLRFSGTGFYDVFVQDSGFFQNKSFRYCGALKNMAWMKDKPLIPDAHTPKRQTMMVALSLAIKIGYPIEKLKLILEKLEHLNDQDEHRQYFENIGLYVLKLPSEEAALSGNKEIIELLDGYRTKPN